MRRLLLATIAALLVTASPAAAGGSWMYPIETNIQPGDTITMVGFSSFGPRQDPEVSADDPFYAYLQVTPSTDIIDDTWPQVHSGTLPLGQMTVTDTGQGGWERYRLHITFEVPPSLESGVYEVVHCNDPCTTNFGELISGGFRVGDPTPEELAASTGEIIGANPPHADLSHPAVAELINESALALTGPTATDYVTIAATLIAFGLILTYGSRRTRPTSSS